MRPPLNSLCLAIGLALNAGLATAADEPSPPMEPSVIGKILLSASDKEFFPAAASAGMLEIESSKLALERSQNTAVKQFAETMVADHTKAADELKALAATKKITLPSAMTKHHQKMYDHLKDEKTAKDFDDAYQEAMVGSHKEAVTLFSKASSDSKDPEVQAWAAKTLPTLQHHGAMAKDLKVD
jgi:putative membrane protein